MTARILSLCSGYGGLDLAVEKVFDAVTVAHAEFDDAPSRVLAERWPGVPNLGDITAIDWSHVAADIFTAGYPCQPFSLGGKRKGADDDRHLWPHIAEGIRRVRPRLVVMENVAGHRSLGFDAVLGDLAAVGYDACWTSLRAADVGAPHGRERVFVLAADTANDGYERAGSAWSGRSGPADGCGPAADASNGGQRTDQRHLRAGQPDTHRGVVADANSYSLRQQPVAEPRRAGSAFAGLVSADFVADASRNRRDERWPEPARLVGGSDAAERGCAVASDAGSERRNRKSGLDRVGRHPRLRSQASNHASDRAIAWGVYEPAIRRWERILGRPAPSPIETGPKGGQRLSPRFVEWMMGLPDGWVTAITGLTRNQLLKLLGNGVVPQQAIAALRRLIAMHEMAVAA